MNRRKPAAASRGFAVIIVLWSLGLIALLGTRLMATARIQARIAADARDHAVAEAAADGAIRGAMFRLLQDPGTLPAIRATRTRIGAASVEIRGQDQSGKVNPNFASREVLQNLMTAVGVEPPRAAHAAGQIVDWRTRTTLSVLGGAKTDAYRARSLPYGPGNRPFSSLNELALVPELTHDLLERLRPWLSVHQEGTMKDESAESLAAAAVRQARASRNAVNLEIAARHRVVELTAIARLPSGARFTRSAIVRQPSSAPPGMASVRVPIQILTWR